jgi:hypothetical protein
MRRMKGQKQDSGGRTSQKAPAAARLAGLSPSVRAELRTLLLDLRRDAQARADDCWRRHKAPMAAY